MTSARKERYRHRPLLMPPEMKDLIRRRTMPFLDSVGVNRPLSFLLEEAYLQGMKDAIQAADNSAEDFPIVPLDTSPDRD